MEKGRRVKRPLSADTCVFTAFANFDIIFYLIYIKSAKGWAVKLVKQQKKKKGLAKINFWL